MRTSFQPGSMTAFLLANCARLHRGHSVISWRTWSSSLSAYLAMDVALGLAACSGEVVGSSQTGAQGSEAGIEQETGSEGMLGEVCDNGVDDDGDKLVDCDDSECLGRPACGARYGAPYEYDCANGVDDDGDGLSDCLDPQCAGAPGC